MDVALVPLAARNLGDLIREMTAFVAPETFPRFNLPQELSA
jgi:hypothetical protein